jgi:hypothetical protein
LLLPKFEALPLKPPRIMLAQRWGDLENPRYPWMLEPCKL